MRAGRYVVGIDLGTTNTVVAYAERMGVATSGVATSGVATSDDRIRLFEIEQLTAPGEVAALPMLPSLRYHPAPGELAAGDLGLPWPAGEPQSAIFGSLARKLGAQVPGRLVASAKSWLSHGAVDRLAPILPWGAAADVPKVSPVDASASYLAYVRAAWNWRFPEDPLEQQDIVLTVPASFDEGARALTLRAASAAGLPQLRLLEEPQAAFHDWLFRHRQDVGAALAHSRLVLVCDVGGGTTDLSLIRVDMPQKQTDAGDPSLPPVPELTRIGVGKHLMLGGDNMDLVLAHLIEARMQQANGEQAAQRLSATQLSQLVERCRAAKELLLAADGPQRTAVTLLGGGARLIGGARSAELAREEVERLIVDGFFPQVGPDEKAHTRRGGIVEFGLPYASDPAVTRHLAGFLQQHADAARAALGGDQDDPAIPDTLLLNGGVFRAGALATRLEDTLSAWRGKPVRLLHNVNPDVAVARGAVAYSLARLGQGLKIGGGSPRAYFLALDAQKPSGAEQSNPNGESLGSVRQGICILPRGTEAGQEILLRDRKFALRVGQPVRFHLVSSTTDQRSAAGELVDLGLGDYTPLPPVATVLKAEGKKEIPVQLMTALTEIGTLEIDCVDASDESGQLPSGKRKAGNRWHLEFQLRGETAGADTATAEPAATLPPRFAEAVERIERIFGARSQAVPPKEVRQLRLQLEKLLGSRDRWDTPLLRHLFDTLWKGARARRRSAEHERIWLNLVGFCLRPGYGYPLDDWRIGELWSIFEAGVQHRNDNQVCSEWWTLWRRVAGGLDRDAQLRLLDDFAFNVQADEAERKHRPQTLVNGNFDDMLRVAASLERIPADYKAEIGAWLLENLRNDAETNAPDARVLWALGRIGARQPFYGSAHDVLAPEIAASWLQALCDIDWRKSEPAAFAAAHIARMSGDRSRDLPEEMRREVVARLKAIGAPATWVVMVREVVQLDEASERRIFGESLPPGLKLIG